MCESIDSCLFTGKSYNEPAAFPMTNLKIHIIAVFVCFSPVLDLTCQENSIYLNSYINPFITNPGCTGVEYYPVINLSVKKQWLDFPDSPSTFLFSGNVRLKERNFYNSKGLLNKGPLKLSDRIGLGAIIYHDENGPLTNTGVLLSYAYHIPISHENRLSLGISCLMADYGCNSSMLRPAQRNDGYLLNGNENIYKLNYGIGIYYHTKNYFAGIAVNKILPGISNAGQSVKMRPSWFILGGYKFTKNNSFINFEPSLEFRKLADEKPMLDVHSKIYIKRLNWMAVSYSTSKHINVQLAFQIYKKFYLGYNYGYSLGKIANYNYRTQEISLGINLGLNGIEDI